MKAYIKAQIIPHIGHYFLGAVSSAARLQQAKISRTVSYPAKQESDRQSNHCCTYANCRQGDKRYSKEDYEKAQKLVMENKLFKRVVNTIFKTRDTLYERKHICLLLTAV